MSAGVDVSSAPPPQKGKGDGMKDKQRIFMAMNVIVEDKRVVDMYIGRYSCLRWPTYRFGFSCDTGANVHRTGSKDDIRSTRAVDQSCTSGNKGELKAMAMSEISSHVKAKG